MTTEAIQGIDRPHEIKLRSLPVHRTTTWYTDTAERVARIQEAADAATHEKTFAFVPRSRRGTCRIATAGEVALRERAVADLALFFRWEVTGRWEGRMTQGVVEAKYTLGVFVPATVCRDAGGEVVDVIRGHHTPESLRAVIAAERRAMDESHAYLSAADAAVERERVEYEAGGRRAKDARARAERRAARTAVEHYRANEAKYRANGHDYEALLAAAMQAAGMA